MRDHLEPKDWHELRNLVVHEYPVHQARLAFRILRLHGEAGESPSKVFDELNELASATSRLATEEEIVKFLSSRLKASHALREAARTLRNKSLPRRGGSRIATPPGMHLRAFADAVFSPKTRRLVLEPTLCDLYDEYCEALKEGRPWKARWASARGYWSFWSAAVAQLPVSLARKLLDIWKAVS